jgi:hypothetical protein
MRLGSRITLSQSFRLARLDGVESGVRAEVCGTPIDRR